MKHRRLIAVGIALAALAGPLLLLQTKEAAEPLQSSQPAQIISSEAVQPEAPSFDQSLLLRVKTEDGVEEMSLYNYLMGVLAAEMPSSFSPPALEAQAVASRTYALRRAASGKHPEADVCTDSACCQAWCAPDAEEAIAAAVQATDGLVVTYEDKLIDATFFSCANGSTEAAVAVWGGDVPYLQAVDSPEHVEKYEQTVTVPAAEFAEKLRQAYPEAVLEGTPETWFGASTQTAGGGIDTVLIGGVSVRGTSLRKLFSLRSTRISITPTADSVEFSTQGYGHRVGMSQYGAEAMAQAGSDFEEILLHYYQGTQLQRLVLDEE